MYPRHLVRDWILCVTLFGMYLASIAPWLQHTSSKDFSEQFFLVPIPYLVVLGLVILRKRYRLGRCAFRLPCGAPWPTLFVGATLMLVLSSVSETIVPDCAGIVLGMITVYIVFTLPAVFMPSIRCGGEGALFPFHGYMSWNLLEAKYSKADRRVTFCPHLKRRRRRFVAHVPPEIEDRVLPFLNEALGEGFIA
jgi:hypothetical protein